MKLVIGTPNIKPDLLRPIVAMGNFDGLHLGHQAILRETVARARDQHGTAVALTFEPHPSQILTPERALRLLDPFQTKIRRIESTGIDVVLVVDFNRAFSEQTPGAFAEDFLRDKIRCHEMIVGEDYRFGRQRLGDVETLKVLGQRLGFGVRTTPPVWIENHPISSSLIRRLIGEGQMQTAALMLGRAYAISGPVIQGDGMGKTLGVPTANIRLPNELMPMSGIYAVRVDILKTGGIETCDGVAYIGCRPTFHRHEVRLEVHLLGRDENLYNRRLQVRFVARVREDLTFEGQADLVRQMHADIEAARILLSSPNAFSEVPPSKNTSDPWQNAKQAV